MFVKSGRHPLTRFTLPTSGSGTGERHPARRVEAQESLPRPLIPRPGKGSQKSPTPEETEKLGWTKVRRDGVSCSPLVSIDARDETGDGQTDGRLGDGCRGGSRIDFPYTTIKEPTGLKPSHTRSYGTAVRYLTDTSGNLTYK